MKTIFKSLLAVTIATGVQSSYGALLLQYNFDAPPNSTTSSIIADNSGNGHTADLTTKAGAAAPVSQNLGAVAGVSGNTGDYAVTFNTSGSPSALTTSNAVADLPALTSYTFTGWFMASTTWAAPNKILQGGGTSGIPVIQANPTGDLNFSIDGTGVATSGGQFNQVGTWTFFAVTIGDGSYNIWRGDATTAVTSVASGAWSGGTWDYNPGASGNLAWGNRLGDYARAFNGTLDDLRIYGETSGTTGALTSTQLDAVRLAAVPEPSTVALITLNGLGVLLLGRRRRNS